MTFTTRPLIGPFQLETGYKLQSGCSRVNAFCVQMARDEWVYWS